METGCNFEKYFEGYFNGDLAPVEDMALQKHLLTCSKCRNRIDILYTVHTALKSYRRQQAAPALLDSYHRQVDLSYTGETFLQKISLFIHRFTDTGILSIRIAQITTLIVIGVIIGWLVFTPAEPRIIVQNSDPYQTSRPVSSVDIDYVYYYLLASEMILLEITNSVDQPEFYIDRELAHKLLIKTFRAHEIALKLNNTRMLSFLTRMEFLLLEASNLSDEEIHDALDTLRMMIKEAELLREVKILQSILKQKRSQSGT